jgi:F-type H+-transporting ATPase subunit a
VSPIAAAHADTFVAPGVSDFWQPLFGDGAFAITRPMVVYGLAAIAICVILIRSTRQLSVVPSKRQFLVEGSYNLIRNSVGREIIGAKDFKPFMPLLYSLFIVILVNNLFGVVPLIQFPTFSRLGFPVALTIIVYFTYHVVGIRRKGLVGYFKSFVPSGLPGWLIPIMFVLEFATNFLTRPVTLALRLFGNMFAGHLLLLVFTFGGEYLLLHSTDLNKVFGVLSFGTTILMSFFEVLIEFLQAYLFALLAALYIAGAVADEH